MAIEFVEKMLLVFSEDEYKKVLKEASIKGVTIAGFSKNYAMVPRKMIITKLKQKVKKKYYYEIFLDVFYELLDKENTANESNLQYIKRWRDNENDHDGIMQELDKIIQSSSFVKTVATSENIEKENDKPGGISQEEYNKVLKINNELRERNKKLQNSVMKKKIEIDNLNKELQKISKDYEKQSEEKKMLENKLLAITQTEELLKTEIINKDKMINQLQIQNNELGKYRENALRVICFISSKDKIEFMGYNILFIERWSVEVRDELRDEEFDEIWYVHKGFQYSDFIEIKNAFSCNVVEFANISHLMQQKGGSYVKR